MMKSYLFLVIRYLKFQRKRTLLMILGLALAVAMVTVPGIMKSSSHAISIQSTIERHGSYSAVFKGLTQEKLNILKNHTQVKTAGEFMVLNTFQLPGKKPSISTLYCDIATKDIYKEIPLLEINLEQGRFPKAAGEIALEQWVLDELPQKPSLGDQIHLDKDYTLVGILKDAYYTKFSGNSRALVSRDELEKSIPAEKRLYNVYAEYLKGASISKISKLLQKDLGYKENVEYNQNLQWEEENGGENDWIAFFLLAVIIIIAAVSIHNVFSISVLERIRQFGLLRCIGTAPYQIRRIVAGEALLLAVISIPLGLAAGIGLSVVSIKFFPILQSNGSNAIVIPAYSLLLASAFCFFSIAVSVILPAFRAGRISPLEAVNSNSEVLKEGNGISRGISGWVKKLLGIGGKMAYQNLRRQKKRFWATITSMCLGIIAFIVCSYYAAGAVPAQMIDYTFAGDYMIRAWNGQTDHNNYSIDQAKADIKDTKDVTEVFRSMLTYDKVLYSRDELNPKYKSYVEKEFKGYELELDQETKRYSDNSSIFGYSENALKLAEKYLVDGEVNIDRMSKSPEVLYVNSTTLKNKNIKPSSLKAGDYVYLRMQNYDKGSGKLTPGKVQKFKIAGVLKNLPVKTYFAQDAGIIIFHENMYKQHAGPLYTQFDIKVKPDADLEGLESKLKDVDEKLKGQGLISYQKEIEDNKKIIQQVTTISYLFVFIITFIGVFNIINIINAGMILRIREFGILRATGMTPGQLKKMVVSEGLLLGAISAFLGIVAGNIVAYFLYLVAKADKMPYLVWNIPLGAILGAFIGSIVLGICASLLPLRRISKMNIVQSIGAIE